MDESAAVFSETVYHAALLDCFLTGMFLRDLRETEKHTQFNAYSYVLQDE